MVSFPVLGAAMTDRGLLLSDGVVPEGIPFLEPMVPVSVPRRVLNSHDFLLSDGVMPEDAPLLELAVPVPFPPSPAYILPDLLEDSAATLSLEFIAEARPLRVGRSLSGSSLGLFSGSCLRAGHSSRRHFCRCCCPSCFPANVAARAAAVTTGALVSLGSSSLRRSDVVSVRRQVLAGALCTPFAFDPLIDYRFTSLTDARGAVPHVSVRPRPLQTYEVRYP